MPSKCVSITKTGNPCIAVPLKGLDFCWFHAPSLAEERLKARVKGGKKGRKVAETSELRRRLRALEERLGLQSTP